VVDETGGYRIGIRDVYTLVLEVSAKLDKSTNEHTLQIAQLKASQETAREAMRRMWERLEEQEKHLAGHEREADAKRAQHVKDVNAELDKRGTTNWQVNLAIAAAMISLLIALLQLVAK
jgi:hypothetical protein